MGNKPFIQSILIFVCWPLLALTLAIKNFKASYSKNIVWLFCMFFGLTFGISSNSQKSDIIRYLNEFHRFKVESKGFAELFGSLYAEGYGFNDIYFPFISMISAKLDLPDYVYLAVLGLVFGYFFSRVFAFFAEAAPNKIDFFIAVIFLTFFMVIPIWRGINGVRYSLAAIMFVYVLLSAKKDGWNFKRILILASTALVHFSMIFVVVVIVAYALFNKYVNLNILFITYLGSFFIMEIDLDQLNQMLNQVVPSFLSGKVDAYARSGYIDEIEQRTANTNWYALLYFKALNYAVALMIFYIYYNRRIWINESVKFHNFFKFILFFSIFVNISNLVPSGGRMSLISIMLTIYFFVELYPLLKFHASTSALKIVTTPLLLFYVLIQLRIGADFISLETLVGNPISGLLFFDKIAIIDLLK
jgi:hypothetical protein